MWRIPGASNDKSWYYVVDSTGQSGYIPRNYVLADRTGEGFEQHIDMLRDRVRWGVSAKDINSSKLNYPQFSQNAEDGREGKGRAALGVGKGAEPVQVPKLSAVYVESGKK